jgi:hypothetical protein
MSCKNSDGIIRVLMQEQDTLKKRVAELEKSNRVLVSRIEELDGGPSENDLYFRRLAAGGDEALKEHNRRYRELNGIKDGRGRKKKK